MPIRQRKRQAEASSFRHRVNGIDEKIEENLADLIRIAKRQGKAVLKDGVDRDAVLLNALKEHVQRVANGAAQVHRPAVRGPASCKRQQLIHEPRDSFDLRDDDFEPFSGSLVVTTVQEMLRAAQYDVH